jgi:hypothetical protein
MVTLYIIGAGCSRNYDQSISPVPDLKPPLNEDFFKMAKKVVDFYDLSFMYSPILGLNHLIRDMCQIYGYKRSEHDTRVLDDDRLNLEAVMNYFYFERMILERDFSLGLPPSRSGVLDNLLAYTISESIGGPICNKHLLLAERMQKGDVVWNFNYDFLMDSALYAQNKLTDSGYVIRFDYTLVGDEWEKAKDSESPVTLLKLHGSLNWLRCRSCGRFLLIRCIEPITELWIKIRDLQAWGKNPTVTCPRCGAPPEYGLERIIIPPSLIKSYEDVEIRSIWRYADSFENIKNLIIIGFRLAEQDAGVDMLLRNMVQQGSIPKDVPIHIVNTHPSKVELRLKSVFSKANITCESPKVFFKTST